MAGTATTGWDVATAIGTCVAAGTVFIAFLALISQWRSDRANSNAQTRQLEIQSGQLQAQTRQLEIQSGQLETQTQQLDQGRLASQARVYQSLLDKAERIGLTQALETVRNLQYDDYDDFRAHTSDVERENVVIAASFFNEVQRLLDAKMLDYKLVTKLWGVSILSCADHLWVQVSWRNRPESWWLNGFRAERSKAFEAPEMSKYFYLGFEEICIRVKGQFVSGSPGRII